jgi:plastocyanin
MKKTIFSLLVISALVLNAGAATIWVDAVDNLFHARHLYVPVGTTVVWTNFGMHTHTVTSNTLVFNSGDLTTGQTFSFTFNTVGDYDYFCTYHPMMLGAVHVRTTPNLTFALSMTPIGGPIVIPASGGSFQYNAQGTNQTNQVQPTTYWTKLYPPNNGMPSQTFQKGVTLPPSGTRGATLQTVISAASPPGLYRFVGYVGSNPDSVLAWNSFTFTKLASTLEGTGWETTIIEDWHDVTPTNNSVVGNQQTGAESVKISNYPEPFNPSTTIRFNLPMDGAVSLEVFNLTGARVATLVHGYQAAGDHQVAFDASGLPSGLYVYRMNYAGQTLSNKMMLIK